MTAHQAGCCCGGDCCACRNIPSEWVVDFGPGGLINNRAIECPTVAGEFTLHTVPQPSNLQFPPCVWDFHDYNWSIDLDPDVGPFPFGPSEQPFALQIFLKMGPKFLDPLGNRDCERHLQVFINAGTPCETDSHFQQIKVDSDGNTLPNSCFSDFNGTPFPNVGKGSYEWRAQSFDQEKDREDCGNEFQVEGFTRTSVLSNQPCHGDLPNIVTIRRPT